MDGERIISVFEERMRLQHYAASTIKSYKEYLSTFLKEIHGYKKLSHIPILSIEAFLSKKVIDDKISSSYQRS